MKKFDNDELQIIIEEKESKLYMKWVGVSQDLNPSESLRPYLTEFIENINIDKLTVDFSFLELMNSSTVIVIIEFVKNLENNQIQTELVYDKNVAWQHTSFLALNKVVTNYEFVEIVGIEN